MTKSLTAIFLAANLLWSCSIMAMTEVNIEGEQYKRTEPTRVLNYIEKDKIEVIVIFSYRCRYCFYSNKLLEKWEKSLPSNADIVLMPLIPENAYPWEVLWAKLFYAARNMGVLEKLHPLIFEALHVENRRLMTEEDIFDFVEDNGIDRKKFTAIMNSFEVAKRTERATAMGKQVHQPEVMAGNLRTRVMIVNDKYLSSNHMADDYLKVVHFLVQKESMQD